MDGLDFQSVHDRADALLRDPQTPDDVRAFVRTVFGVAAYLDRVEFVTDSDGVTNVVPKSQTPPGEVTPAQAPAPAPAASGSSPETPAEGGEATPPAEGQ